MKAAVYTRVSSQMQVNEGFSLEAQHDRLLDYVRMNSWDLVRVYTDPGVSAKDLNRPGVKEMIADLKAGKFASIVVHKLDRLTRNISDLYDLVELVNEKNVKLISLSENIDTSTPMGRMFVYLLGIFAQMFRENLREETLKGLTKRAEQGLRNTKAPLGYEMDDDGNLIVVPEGAEIVREVFRLYTEKKIGFGKIATILNQRNIGGAMGGRFHQSTIVRIISNHSYIGKNHWKPKDAPESERIIGQAIHEPIVEVRVFEKAQEIWKRRSAGEMSRSSYDYPFSGILKCGRCGSSMTGHRTQLGYFYYRCLNKFYGYGNCDISDVSEMKIEYMFFEHFRLLHQGLAYNEAAAAKESGPSDVAKERKRIERELAKSATRRSNWQYAFGDGKMPYEDYVKMIDAEMNRVEELQRELTDLPEEKPVKITPSDVLEVIMNLKENWPLLERSTRKDFVNTFFKRIVVQKREKKWSIIDVEWA